MVGVEIKVDLVRVRKELSGRALRLFLYLSKRSSGYTIDEMKYFGGFSNKALINQCLAEMKRLGIVDKRGDKYYVPRLIADAVNFTFKHYAKVGSRIIPRGFLAAMVYAAFLVTYIVLVPPSVLLLPLGLIAEAIFIVIGVYERHKMVDWVKRLERLG
ncbi:MAG: hypothetical protein N3F04_05160 [Candidatus Nezhaarchaeota archaeon]|nr:hypothetical protein [Candidatus Nezhaarchaeota archaeon]MCX8142135.1 hypothetical protein [Candidatus Nezhaarchaeota archaeon]MDW8050084.1 hypothetical protein [Nitrososphaerota archaeon]